MSEQASPAISVIIPAYNMAEYVGSAINSVLEGDFDEVEVVVVNDGSTDETGEVVSQYTVSSESNYDERVHYVSQSNQGKAAAVNHGLSVASGSYVTILDADDELTPDSLSSRYAHRTDEYGRRRDLVIGGFEVFDDDGTHGTRLPPDVDSETLRQRFYSHWKTPFSLNACLISKGTINRAGKMDERFLRCLDIDYAMRILRAAGRTSTIQSVVYRYRKHRTLLSERLQTRLRTTWYRARVIQKNCYGWRKWVALPFGLVMDVGKFGYELLVGNYKN